MKRAITLLAALVLTVSLAAPALALGDIDLGHGGTIKMAVQPDHAEEYAEDLSTHPVTVAVYQVATVNEHGAFKLTDAFASLADTDPDAWNNGIVFNKPNGSDPAVDADAQVKELLAAALALVKPEPAEGEEPGESTVTPFYHDTISGLGSVIDVPLGLFLVVPEHLTTSLWEYEFSPALLAAPSIRRTAGDADDGEWVYDVPMYLKCERERRLMDMEIVKNLRTYNRTLGPATFVFDVTAMLDTNGDGVDELVFQSTAEITFDETTGYQNKAVVKNIPAGAKVTVTEVYTGESYELVGSSGGGIDGAVASGNTVTFEIVDLRLPDGQDIHRVEFTNDYTGGRIPDAHVENIFTANGNAQWQWHNDKNEGGNG